MYERVHQSNKGIKNPACVYRCMSTYYRFPSYSKILNKFNMNIQLHKTKVNLTSAISVFTRGNQKSRIVNAEEIVQVATLEKATCLFACWVFFTLLLSSADFSVNQESNLVGPTSQMLHSKSSHQPSGSHEEDVKSFFHKWAWWLLWSCDLDH